MRFGWLLLAASLAALLTGCGASSASRSSATRSSTTRSSATMSTAGTARSGPVPRASGFGSDWTTYHGDAEATGVDATQTKLRPSRPAWTSSALDGQLYGEPLVADGRVVAATENNTVYVMAARSGRILWSRHLGEARAIR